MNYTFNTALAQGGWRSTRNLPGSFTMPPTTDTTLVFHYNRSKNKFDRSFYSSALTHGRMSWDQVDSFLCDVEFILKKKLRSLWTASILALFFLLMGFFILASFMFDLDSDYADDYDDDESVFYALFAYFALLIICSIGLHFHRKEVLSRVRTSVQNVINQNKPVLENLGLRWNIPTYFPRWIELCKDYYVPQMYPDQASQSYFSYPIPQQLVMPQRPVIQNPIFNQHYQNYMKSYVYPMSMPPQQLNQNSNDYYQPPAIHQGGHSDE